MKRPPKPKRGDFPIQANEYQRLGDRIRYLRSQTRPVMTQQQLADRAGLNIDTIGMIETSHPRGFNPSLVTLKKIAHALDCRVFVTIRPRVTKRKPVPGAMECLLEYPEAPVLPKRTHKASGRALFQAGLTARSYLKNYRRRKYHEQHKVTSGTRDLGLDQYEKDVSPPTPPDKPSPARQTPKAQD